MTLPFKKAPQCTQCHFNQSSSKNCDTCYPSGLEKCLGPMQRPGSEIVKVTVFSLSNCEWKHTTLTWCPQYCPVLQISSVLYSASTWSRISKCILLDANFLETVNANLDSLWSSWDGSAALCMHGLLQAEQKQVLEIYEEHWDLPAI